MTTNTTPSTASQAPAVSIDDEEFSRMLAQVAILWMADQLRYALAREKLVAHIDAKLAQSAEALRGQNELLRLELDDVRAALARERTSQTAAEAKLEAIRQGVRECVGFGFDKDGPNWISRHHVLALFQPQPQADESGLPG